MWFRRGLWLERDFFRLWAAATTSSFGSMVRRIAMPFVAILVLDAGPGDLAWLAVADVVPGLAFILFAGAWADRVRRRPILIVADLGRAAALVTIPLAWAFDALRMEQLYAVSLVMSTLAAFFHTAHRAYLPALVHRDRIVDANSKLAAGDSVAEAGAFPAAGWLVQWLTAPVTLLVDALSFVASAAWLFRIEAPEAAPAPKTRERRVLSEIREGFVTVVRHPVLLSIGILQAANAITFQAFGVVYMVFVTKELGFETGVLGMIFALGSLSSVAAAFATSRVVDWLGTGPAILIGLAIGGVAVLFVPAAVGATWMAALLLSVHQILGDGPLTVAEISSVSVVQRMAPGEQLGRVVGSLRFAGFAAMLLGAGIGGVLGETIGLRATMLVSASVLLVTAAGLCFSPLRTLREVATPEAEPASPSAT